MSHRVIFTGLATCLLVLAFASSQSSTAQAQTAAASTNYCFVDQDGNPVPSKPAGRGWTPASDPGSWVNPGTGQVAVQTPGSSTFVNQDGNPVPSKPAGRGWTPASDPGSWVNPGTGKIAVLVPCPPPTQTAGLYLGGQPVLVLGGNVGGGWSRNFYSDFPPFDGSGAGGGVYGAARFYIQPNFFVGPEAGFMLLDINARNPDSAFGFVRSDAYLGGQAGVTVQGPGASKINLYTGLDANWSHIGVGVEVLNERMSKTLGGWSVHGGVEFQPIPSIPTLWLGLDLRHSDVSGTIGGDPTHVRWNMLSVTLSIQR